MGVFDAAPYQKGVEHRYLYGPGVDQVLVQENVTDPHVAGRVLADN